MNLLHAIEARRDGRRNTKAHLRHLAEGAARGTATDYQLAAWLMAAYLRPLDVHETADLTLAMAESGERLDLGDLPHPRLDKHSTGGVGDKTTLVLLPLLAACGLTMVKMSGRGLGITGGTVDKLSAVPGLRLDLSPAEMVTIAGRTGIALTGQTPALAPADGALYALRDVTGTVASVPLIVSSILSKKIAGGAETVVLDVKHGSGAFMPDLPAARELADWLVRVGERCGLTVRAAITDMDQPLGRAAGNALEVAEARAVLRGEEKGRFRDLCLDLAGLALEATGHGARADALARLEDGSAAAKWKEWITAQGGDPDFAPEPAPFVHEVRAERDGWVARVDARAVGEAVVALGGGRRKKTDRLDLRVGVETLVAVGDKVRAGELLYRVHAAREEFPPLSVGWSDAPVPKRALVWQ